MKRPIGVLFLGFLSLVAGFAFIFYGLQFMGAVTFGPFQAGSGLWAYGLLVFLSGIAFAAAGFAFWSLQSWAWLFGQIMAVFGLVDAVILMLSSGELNYGLAAAIFPLLILWYLNRDVIKKAFGVSDA